MDPVTLVLVAGPLGGLIVAVLFFMMQGRGGTAAPRSVPSPAEPLSTNVINMARIRVAGVGGFGLVAMAVAVAVDLPRVGQTVAIGMMLGLATALVLVVRRRRSGSMPSSGRRMGANIVLSIDSPQEPPATQATGRDSSDRAAVADAPLGAVQLGS